MHSGQTRRALSVDCAKWHRVRNAGVELSHSCNGRSSTRRQDVADRDVLNELWIQIHFGIDGSQHCCEQVFRMSVLEASLASLFDRKRNISVLSSSYTRETDLCNGRSVSRDDYDVVVVLCENCSLSAHLVLGL